MYIPSKKSLFLLCVFFFICSQNSAAAKNIQNLFKKVNPSVVEIKTLSVDTVAVAFDENEFVERLEMGSGVLISQDGKILTASHVVQSANEIVVKFIDGQEIPARILISAPWADIALLQLDFLPSLNKPTILANSDKVEVGEQVFVIGAPFGLSHTLTVGHVSARHYDNGIIGNFAQIEHFQTDAAVNSGNSGGPMFNMKGEIIGIVSHIKSRSGGFEGIGFAVTSNVAKEFITGKNFWSGIEGFMLTGKLAKIFNLPQDTGMLVQYVAKGSPAAKLGLKPSSVPIHIWDEKLYVGGDIILEFGGIPVADDMKTFSAVRDYLNSLNQGDKFIIKVMRRGNIITLTAKKDL